MLAAVMAEPLETAASIRSSSIHLSIAEPVVRTEKTRQSKEDLVLHSAGRTVRNQSVSAPCESKSRHIVLPANVRSAIENALGSGIRLSSFVLPEKGGGGEDSEAGFTPMT